MNNRSNNDHSETISACEIFRQLREQHPGTADEHPTLLKEREPLIIAWMACKKDKVVINSLSHDGIFFYKSRDKHKPCLHPEHRHSLG